MQSSKNFRTPHVLCHLPDVGTVTEKQKTKLKYLGLPRSIAYYFSIL